MQKFVDAVVEYFINNSPDLMTREFERTGVKLHATILNSKFRDLSGRKKGLAQRVAYKPPESFDATRIFKASSITLHCHCVTLNYVRKGYKILGSCLES